MSCQATKTCGQRLELALVSHTGLWMPDSSLNHKIHSVRRAQSNTLKRNQTSWQQRGRNPSHSADHLGQSPLRGRESLRFQNFLLSHGLVFLIFLDFLCLIFWSVPNIDLAFLTAHRALLFCLHGQNYALKLHSQRRKNALMCKIHYNPLRNQ